VEAAATRRVAAEAATPQVVAAVTATGKESPSGKQHQFLPMGPVPFSGDWASFFGQAKKLT
jgi:hypothetical protein